MRGYYVPLVSGVVLVLSTLLPWIRIGDATLSGISGVPGLWIAGLGAIAIVLAALSLITRRNSRHPLLVVGLVALGIMVLSWRVLPHAASDRASSLAQATAIVEETEQSATPDALVGLGIYIGTAAAAAIALFGLTIVVKRVQQPYAIASQDDDV